MAQMAGNVFVETSITIPSNNIARTKDIREFIQEQFPDADVLIEFSLIDTPSTANQFVKYKYDENFSVISQRLVNNTPTTVIWNSPDYIAYLVQGTQYAVKYLKSVLP